MFSVWAHLQDYSEVTGAYEAFITIVDPCETPSVFEVTENEISLSYDYTGAQETINFAQYFIIEPSICPISFLCSAMFG